MGYRPNLVKKYSIEYAGTLSGFNYAYDEFSSYLQKLGVEFFEYDSKDEHEINSEDLLKLEKKIHRLNLNEDELENAKALIEIAKNSGYAKKAYVKIEWF